MSDCCVVSSIVVGQEPARKMTEQIIQDLAGLDLTVQGGWPKDILDSQDALNWLCDERQSR